MACPFARQQTALWCNCTCLSYALLWRHSRCYGYHHANRLAKADIQQSSQRAQLFLPVSCWRLIVWGPCRNASRLRCTRTWLTPVQRLTLCVPGRTDIRREDRNGRAAEPLESMTSCIPNQRTHIVDLHRDSWMSGYHKNISVSFQETAL